jgi:hypothetical protein
VNVNKSRLLILATPKEIKKLYCYVDESGQDAGSNFFIVVSIVSGEEQNQIRDKLMQAEEVSKVHARKWFNSRSPVKEDFLRTVIKTELAKGDVYYSKYKKPLPFFAPMLETIEKAIKDKANGKPYLATVYVDGIDKKKAQELTGWLRHKGIKLQYVRSARDESEPFIRLADRWAGCIRDSLEGKEANTKILSKAEKDHYIKHI